MGGRGGGQQPGACKWQLGNESAFHTACDADILGRRGVCNGGDCGRRKRWVSGWVRRGSADVDAEGVGG